MSKNKWGIDNTWTLFLDRDGVINERIVDGYVTTYNDFRFIEGVKDAIRIFSDVFQHIFVVTNQQGVGKGLMTEYDLLKIHGIMCDEIYQEGGRITKCYFAPNLKGAEDDMRKPGTAMGELAKMEFPEIDFSKSIMVGDTDSDILFGKNLGMKTVRILTKEEPIKKINADLEVKNLLEFANILKEEK